MGVYIKGMKIPTSCDKCPIMVFEDTNCAPELYCGCPIVFKAHPQGVGHRPDYCPLIELPPHGRLIDADNLLINKSINIIGKGMIFGGQYVFSESEIVNAPTIIPAEEGT